MVMLYSSSLLKLTQIIRKLRLLWPRAQNLSSKNWNFVYWEYMKSYFLSYKIKFKKKPGLRNREKKPRIRLKKNSLHARLLNNINFIYPTIRSLSFSSGNTVADSQHIDNIQFQVNYIAYNS